MNDLFNGARVITTADKIAAIKRELGYRRAEFPKQIAAKKMSREKADHEIALMEAILRDYEARP